MPDAPATPPPPAPYVAARLTLRWLLDAAYDFTLSGEGNVPPHGPLVFAANHASFLDPPAIGAKIDRWISYFARDTLFRGIFGKGLRAIGTIPVARDHADVASLKAVFRVLRGGGAVAIYPEGTRSHDGCLAEPKPGAGMIVCKSAATVVPTRVFGTYEALGRQRKWPRIGGTIHIAYGPPIPAADIDPGKEHPERYLETSRRIMARIAAIEPPEAPSV